MNVQVDQAFMVNPKAENADVALDYGILGYRRRYHMVKLSLMPWRPVLYRMNCLLL